MEDLVRIGTEFSYLGKRWKIISFSTQNIIFKSLDGSIQSQMDRDMFLRAAESLVAPRSSK